MKGNKAHKRITKVEALISDLVNRYSAGASHVAEALQSAKAAVTRAREAVGLEASSDTPKKNAPRKKKAKKTKAKSPTATRKKDPDRKAVVRVQKKVAKKNAASS